MERRLVVGVDGSDAADAALRWASERAHSTGAALHLVLVGLDADVSASAPDLLLERAGTTRTRNPQLRLTAELVRGPFPEALLAATEEDDLLVIGTGKSGFIHGRVYGSRPLQTAALATCDLVVVPRVDLRFRTGVVGGIAEPDSAEAIAEAAADEAELRGEALLLLTAFDGRDRDGGRQTLDAAQRAAAARSGVSVRVVRSPRRPSEALLDATRNASLLVLGPGTARRRHPRLGSVAHDVLMNANAPILLLAARTPTGDVDHR